MKRLSLIVFLVCLMSNSVFARYYWMQADESTPQYAATDNWMEPNQWDEVPPPGPSTGPPSEFPGVPPLATTLEINMITKAWMSETAHCTINSNVGIYSATSESGGRININGTLYVKDDAFIGVIRTGSKNGLRVGSQAAGGITTTGTVEQTAGTVTVSNLYLGYGGTMTSDLGAEGYYVISGGSLTITDNPQSGGLSTGGLSIASGVNQAPGQPILSTVGTFTVVGPLPVITVTSLTVGGNITAGNLGTSNSGTLEFKLGSGVSSIDCSSRVAISQGPNTTANLVVSLMDESAPPPVIVLVKNSSNNAVSGTFDSVTLNGAGLAGYTVVYNYNADGTANDIALIPEPATIALFGLGLLALVRRPRSK